jgi:hypothetical protein
MSEQSDNPKVECSELTEEQKARASRADEMYCKMCEEKGMKVCTWEEFDAWQKYVEGQIDESQLKQKAEVEVNRYSESFGKFLVIQQEEPVVKEEKEEKKGRVKKANQIYKQVCEERGLNLCFFNNFATWSEYVEGRMSDSEFHTKADLEVDKIKSQ